MSRRGGDLTVRATAAQTLEAVWAVRTGWTRTEFRATSERDIYRLITLINPGKPSNG